MKNSINGINCLIQNKNTSEKLLIRYLVFLTFLIVIILFPEMISAHPIHDLNSLSAIDTGWIYLQLGFTHIIPYGADHILFVLGLFLLSPKIKPLLVQISVFTIAHSITLSLAVFNVISIPEIFIEPVIALSIVFIAVENIYSRKLNSFRVIVIFIFGLIHGLGFAGVLKELGLPKDQFVNALISFNVGVEFGQISVVLIAFISVGIWFRAKSWYRNRILIPGSVVIALIACYWAAERLIH
ncbi:MAG: HupE/UreJ family protein [Ignavibacteria bacterium]|nr:HupE/UreJ family protein [Ignavibacteria bacterium]